MVLDQRENANCENSFPRVFPSFCMSAKQTASLNNVRFVGDVGSLLQIFQKCGNQCACTRVRERSFFMRKMEKFTSLQSSIPRDMSEQLMVFSNIVTCTLLDFERFECYKSPQIP